MRLHKLLISAISLMLLSYGSLALAASPVGKWQTVDDKSHKVRSIVQLWIANGQLQGKIIKVFKQAGDTGRCNHCSGKFKQQPVEGLHFMWGLQRKSDRVWDHGKILDPKNGKIYSCKVTVSARGDKLVVRGYIGFALLGRSQTWSKVA